MTDRLVEPEAAAEIERLRSALIQCGREAGCFLADNVSTDFLMFVPAEVRARLSALEPLPQTDLEQRAREIAEQLKRVAHIGDGQMVTVSRYHICSLADLRAITKALASSSVPDRQWQDIATAPKDGQFLVYSPKLGVGYRFLPLDPGVPDDATHWMSNPPPPAPQDRGASQEDGRP